MAHRTYRSFRPALLTAALLALGGVAAFMTLGRDDAPPLPAGSAAEGARQVASPAAAAAAAAQPALRTSATQVRGCWVAQPGSTFHYRISDRCDFQIHSAEGGTHPGGQLHTECAVTTTVLDRRTDETLVRQQISSLRFVGTDGRAIENDPIQRSFAAAAEAPVFVRIGLEGQVLGFGFADGLDGDQRNFLRGTLSLFAFEAPVEGATTWTSQAEDTTGSFDASYELLSSSTDDEIAVRRTRVRYTAVAGHDDVPGHTLRGAAEVHFATQLGWLGAVRLDEGMTLALSMLDLQASTARMATVDLLEAGTTSIDVDTAAAWLRAVAPTTGRFEQVGGYAAGNERRQWEQRLQGVTLDQLLTELLHALAAQPVDNQVLDGVFQQLQWLVKLDERVAGTLADQLATRQLTVDVARVVLGALGAAGTPAAQQVLVAVRADLGIEAPVRQAATLACVQLAEPGPALVDGLLEEASSPSALRGSSLLVLGAIGPRATAPLADGRTPVQALLALEHEAAARGELDTWMLAVGNSRAPQTLAIAQRLLGHADASVRGAACVALRSVAGGAALTALVERGLADLDPQVRGEAVLALGRRPEPVARAALQQVEQNDSNEEVRRRARSLLERA